MEDATKTYASIHLKERDKIIERKYEKQLFVLEGKLERLKRANNETLKQLFDAQTRGNRLANSLGFNDIFEAQVAIDTVDHQTPFKECFDRIDKLQQELLVAQDENESLSAFVASIEEEQRQSKELATTKMRDNGCQTTSTSSHLAQELQELKERYDALLEVKESSAARYRADYTKWRNFRNWLFTEEAQYSGRGNKSKAAKENKGKGQSASVMRKKRKLLEIGPDLGNMDEDEDTLNKPTKHLKPPSLGGVVDMQHDKENVAPEPSSSHPNATVSRLKTHNQAPAIQNRGSILNNKSTNLLRPLKGPSSSPTVFIDRPINTKRPLNRNFSIIKRSPEAKDEKSSPKPIRSHIDAVINPCSSETEEDSQDQYHLPFGQPSSPAPDTLPESSQTEADSQSQIFSFPDPTPCPPRPATGTLLAPGRTIVSRDPDTLRPTKVLRLVNEVPSPVASTSTPKPKATAIAPSKDPLTEQKNRQADQTPRATLARPAGSTEQKSLSDYSVYKGRGRYAKDTSASESTINAQFEIDPTENGGLGFQYDEVVRDKNERKRMHAGDCECCRDYYEAVGPLPTRLQPPLWKSPPTTPIKPCEQHQQHPSTKSTTVNKSHRDQINSHKQAISRHRHHWERAKTPPGYWNIGFPDTQEAENINEQAKEMHRKKLQKIEAAAMEEVGPYRRRL